MKDRTTLAVALAIMSVGALAMIGDILWTDMRRGGYAMSGGINDVNGSGSGGVGGVSHGGIILTPEGGSTLHGGGGGNGSEVAGISLMPGAVYQMGPDGKLRIVP